MNESDESNEIEGVKRADRVHPICTKDGHRCNVVEISLGPYRTAITCPACLWNKYEYFRQQPSKLEDKCGELERNLKEALARVGELELELRRRGKAP